MTQNKNSIDKSLAAEFQPILQSLETQRIKTRNQGLLSAGLIAIAAAALIWILRRSLGDFATIIVAVASVLIWWLINREPVQHYRTQFKQQVVQRLVNHYNPNFRYSPERGITQSEFSASQIYRHRIDRYCCEDLLEGAIGAATFRFSEVHAQYKTRTHSSKGGTRTSWHTIFKGIFFAADFSTRFSSTTLVLPDQAERLFGGFGQMLQEWSTKLGIQQGELVKLDDPEFERLFVVYSSNPAEARRILSASLMRRLVVFCQRMKQPIALSFTHTSVYIAIPSRKNFFEPPSIWFSSALMGFEEIQTYLNDIKLAQSIVEDLNLTAET